MRCVLSRLPASLRHRDERNWRTCESLRREESEEVFGYCRTILHRTTVLGTRLPSSFPIHLSLSSTYYLTSPNSRRSLSARSFSFSPNPLLFSISSSSFSVSSFSSSKVELTMKMPPSPSRPIPLFSDDAHFHEIVPTYTNFGATWWHGR